jgi:pilus assembly protein Flp/PilA
MFKRIRQFKRDESGVTAIEYGLIAAMVGVAIIGGVTLLGDSLNTMFTDVSTTLDTAVAPAPPATPPATP